MKWHFPPLGLGPILTCFGSILSPKPDIPNDSTPFPVLRQALRQKHLEAQQACRPHNLPVLQAAQHRELEVGDGGGMARSVSSLQGLPGSANRAQELQIL